MISSSMVTVATLFLSALTLVVAGVTLVIVRRQLRVMEDQQRTMRQQTSLMESQLRIVQKQDELMMAQMARRPNLSMKATLSEFDAPNTLLRFAVENTGNKTAHDFYWDLFIPSQFSQRQNFHVPTQGDIQHAGVVQIEGAEYRHFKSFATSPVYPSRSLDLGNIAYDNPTGAAGPFTILWKSYSEDGPFPEGDAPGQISVRLTGF